MTKWKGYYDQYRWEMKEAIDKCTVEREEAAELVIEKYKQVIFNPRFCTCSNPFWHEIPLLHSYLANSLSFGS